MAKEDIYIKNIPLLSGMIMCQNEQKNILVSIENIFNICNEIIIIDGGSKDDTLQVIKEFKEKHDPTNNIKVYQSFFTKHFGDQKNLGMSKVKSMWTLSLDADEYCSPKLIKAIPKLCKTSNIDMYGIPRLNTLDGKKTETWPDYQLRLFKSYCRFVYPCHEEPVGWREREDLKDHLFINHHKSQIKQGNQDQLYDSIQESHIQFLRNDIMKDMEVL